MRKAFYTVLLLGYFCTTIVAQTPKDSAALAFFDRGMVFYNEGKLDSACTIWKQLVKRGIGKTSDVYGHAFFNIPTVYFYQKKFAQAKSWYKKILSSDLKDSGETGSLMEPHTNYKHKSALALASLYELDEAWEEALYWLWKADTTYRYWGFEGSATNISKKKAYLTQKKVEILSTLGREKEAAKLVLTELIYAQRLESFFYESKQYLFDSLDKKAFKKHLDKALKKLSIKEVDSTHWQVSFDLEGEQYTIEVGTTRPSTKPHYWRIFFWDEDTKLTKKSFIAAIQKRQYYEALSDD